MTHMGLPNAWLQWTSILLSTASTRIMMNGAPGQRICHARDLRQGDPLSPLRFIMVMEVLSDLIRTADRWHLFDNLGLKDCPRRALLYADDLVMFVSPTTERDLKTTRAILNTLECAGCNLQNCHMVPMRCCPDNITRATTHFPAGVSQFPIKYLGVPLRCTGFRRQPCNR